ncbi:MAG: LysR family transcriptional regulator, partial [Clostridia bacterium]|nr:LysR family transcriptional regulator [Clostridia bacterium]
MNYLKQIQCVMTIAQEESISRAADKLGIAQPTLSKYLQKLERELGLALFDRNTIPLKLTQAGEYFVQAGAQMMDIDRQLKKKLDSVRENSNLELRLGIGVSRSMYLLPKILSEYRKSNPENRVLIKEGITAEISSELSDGRLDLAVSLLDEHTVQFDHIKLFDETVL